MVVHGYVVEHPSGVFDNAGHIAQSKSISGMSKRDHTRETAKRLFVHDDHPSRQGLRSRARTHVCRDVLGVWRVYALVYPPFGVPQSSLNATELAVGQ
jgi:hypothetical protein